MDVLIELKDDRSEKIRYDRPDYPIYIRRGLLSRYPGRAAPSHWHEDVELILILDGEMDYNVNGQITRLRAGQGIFVNAQQIHFGFSDAGAECSFVCVILHPMLLCATAACERELVLPVLRGGAAFVFLDPDVPWQGEILDQLRRMDRCRGEKSAPLTVQSAFAAVWALLYDHLPRAPQSQDPQSGDLTAARSMAGFIQKNYARRLTLREIAASGAVGQSKCCRLFARYFGQTPNAYLTQYRLDRSLALLLEGGASVTEVALSVGFGGASYYAEVFRRRFGSSPTEYRRRHG